MNDIALFSLSKLTFTTLSLFKSSSCKSVDAIEAISTLGSSNNVIS